MGGFCPKWFGCVALAALLAGLAVPGLCQTRKPPAATANYVKGVKPFPLDLDSGSMALHALSSCLEASGVGISYSRLVGVSGTAFKFVYDTTEAYEPLRDLFPVDALKIGSAAAGFADAHWELDHPIDAVKAIVKREIDKGHPVVAPFLKPDAYNGFFVITGYDYANGLFQVQGAFQETTYATVPIPASWSGPTASPLGWASNPVFVIGDLDPARTPGENLDKLTVAMGIEALKGGTLKYGLTPGEQAYLGWPGEREAAYGIPAYSLLARDVAAEPLVVSPGGVEAVNFAFLWRLDAQLGQLAEDRKYGANTMDLMSTRVTGGKSIEVEAIADNLDKTVADVTDLRKIFWDQIPYGINTADGLVGYVKASKSAVFSFAGRDMLLVELQSLGLKAFRTRWGPAIVEDSPEKRMRARLLVKSIESRERASVRMLEQVSSYVGPDLGVPDQEPPRGRRRKK